MASTFYGSEVTINSGLAQLYPVGSIYLSVNDTNPSTFIGGTWERIKDRFLLAAGDSYAAGSTGGEAQHTLTVDEIPAHMHSQRLEWAYKESWGLPVGNPTDPNSSALIDSGINTGSTGGSQPHNNMPPYLAVYMWVRTA